MSESVKCPLCGRQVPPLLHKQIHGWAVTSDSHYSKALDPHLAYCQDCQYWFTHQREALSNFYVQDYTLLMQDFTTDQLISISSGSVERSRYQASVIATMMKALSSDRVLEVGAGKGLTAHRLCELVKPSQLYLHDPGYPRYFDGWAVNVAPNASFQVLDLAAECDYDLAYTFFTLEHTESPVEDLETIFSRMAADGVFFGVVPWLSSNPGDLLVGDHCSHFSVASLVRLLSRFEEALGIHHHLLINGPLRGLVYVCSRSHEKLRLAVSSLLRDSYPGDFLNATERLEQPDAACFDTARRHWAADAAIDKERKNVLWGAGFYSKVIMLRHFELDFERCVDSNPSLNSTPFAHPDGHNLIVESAIQWVSNSGSDDALWLGVSESARASILGTFGNALAARGVHIAF